MIGIPLARQGFELGGICMTFATKKLIALKIFSRSVSQKFYKKNIFAEKHSASSRALKVALRRGLEALLNAGTWPGGAK